MASRAQWRFGIFAVGLQMAIKLNQVKSLVKHSIFCLFSHSFFFFKFVLSYLYSHRPSCINCITSAMTYANEEYIITSIVHQMTPLYRASFICVVCILCRYTTLMSQYGRQETQLSPSG